MCELLAMSSQAPSTVNLALGVLARHGGGDGPDKDGWGVAYFQGGDVRLVKDAAPAYASPWLGLIEGLSLKSRLVLAHIRRATSGEVALRNTHPFLRELGGKPHVFAHNGSVRGVYKSNEFALGRFRPLGETDSEFAFCALMERMALAWERAAGPPPLQDRAALVAEFACAMRRLGPANFLYADGDALFLHGDRRQKLPGHDGPEPGLHYLIQHDRGGKPFTNATGVAFDESDHPVLLAASVPLTGEAWTPLARGELVAARGGEILARLRT